MIKVFSKRNGGIQWTQVP